MKKKLFVIIFLLIFGVAGGAAWHFWGQRYTIVLTEEQLRETLSQKFPFEKTYFVVIGLRFENPALLLEEGSNRLAFGCDVESNLKLEVENERIPGKLRGAAKLSGVLRYDPGKAEFFLDDPHVETLGIAGVPEKWQAKLNIAAEKAVEEFLAKAPIYKLRPTDVKKAAARLILRSVTVKEKTLRIELGVG